jgi:hypothetical protein
MFEHIVELQRRLQESRNERVPLTKYRMRTAAMDDASKLLRKGLGVYGVCEVYNLLGPSVIST